jgi:hypothetical protein
MERIASAGRKFGGAVRDVYGRHKDLWLGYFRLEPLSKAIAVAYCLGSFLCAILPLAVPIAWVTGGIAESCIGLAILGSVGCFFSAVGAVGVYTQHPGYVHAFQQYLGARLLATIPIFVLDRIELSGCEGYKNELTHRIDPSLLMRRVAVDGYCEAARVYMLIRWLLEVGFALYSIRVMHYLHEHLEEENPHHPDIFEDPVDVFTRLNQRARAGVSAKPAPAGTYGAL